MVLSTLLGGNPAGLLVRLTPVTGAREYFDSRRSAARFDVVVIDERQDWTDWRVLVPAPGQPGSEALVVLLAADADGATRDDALATGVGAVYPRNSAGLLGLARLLMTMASRQNGFGLDDDAAGGDAPPLSPEEEQRKLVYAVSHDLQDPLQLARRYADMLDEDFEQVLGESGAKVLGHLQFNLGRTQEMLDELLEYSRVQRSEPEKKAVDLNHLLDEVEALYALSLEEIGGKLTREQPLPTIEVDPRQFLRVLQNLVGNAIKFRADRPLNIAVRAQQVGDEWRIGIKDNGIGIREEETTRIFDMFERGTAGVDHPGTGMGLAICKRIVQNHGGRIWVRSTPGEGSVFIITVPIPACGD